MKEPNHPGPLIKRELKKRLVAQTAIARKLGKSRQHLNNIMQGIKRISFELAIVLEEAQIGTAREWMIMQLDYDLHQHVKAQHDLLHKQPDPTVRHEFGD